MSQLIVSFNTEQIKEKIFFKILVCLFFLVIGAAIGKGQWTQYQFSLNSSGFFPTNNSFDANLINLTNLNNGSNFQPLADDLNGDNVKEIVVFGANSVFVYNPYLNLKTQYNLGGNILGQPTLFDVNGNQGLELMLNLNVSDVHYFVVYNYSNTFTPISNLTITNNLTGSGIKCTDLNGTKSCVFMDNVFFIHVVNLSNPGNPVDNATQVSLSPNRANTTNYETIPAIADFDNDGNKEVLFWNDNDAGTRFGFVVFDLLDKTKDAVPTVGAYLPYPDSSNQKVGQPIFVKEGSDSLTQIVFASISSGTTGRINNFNGTGSLGQKTGWPKSLSSPDLALISGSLLAIDCDSNGFEDIAGMAEGGATPGRSRLFCYNGDGNQLYSINNIELTDIIEKTATAVNVSGNSTPEVVTYQGIYSFDGTLIYGFAGLGTQSPVPVDVNNDGKLDFLWTNSTNGVRLFTSNDSVAPTFSNLIKSPEPSFKNQIVYINVTWQDPAGVDVAFIAHNGTENWVNYTIDSSFGNNVYNLTVPASNSNYSLKVIGWYSTTNDTAGNRNTTSIQTFVVNNRAPNVTNVLLNNTDFQNRTNGSLIGSWQFSDPDNDNQFGNETLWYINGTENIPFRNLTTINQSNTTKTQNWTFSVRVFDGANFSVFVNSTSLIIQNSAPLLNNSVQNKTWDEDTSTTINLSNSFVDIDGDNLTYNFTAVSNIAISINNNTGVVTLTPDTDFNGIRNVLFFASDGTNLTSSNNVTLTVNDVAEPSTPSSPSTDGSSGGGDGGGGNSGYQCSFIWECSDWSECVNNKQTRNCKLIKVPDFFSLEKCPQNKIPEQSRDCSIPVAKAKESCFDGVQNQGEIGVDCGGPCAPCPATKTKKEENKIKSGNTITGAVVSRPNKLNINYLWLVLAIILMIVALLLYAKLSRKKFFKKNSPAMKKLNKMLNFKIFKK